MIIATFFAIKGEFLWLCLSPLKDDMQIKWQNLIPLKLQGKELLFTCLMHNSKHYLAIEFPV